MVANTLFNNLAECPLSLHKIQLNLVARTFAWRADAVTVRSEEMRELLGRADAYILPSGVDLERFRPIDRGVARSVAA